MNDFLPTFEQKCVRHPTFYIFMDTPMRYYATGCERESSCKRARKTCRPRCSKNFARRAALQHLQIQGCASVARHFYMRVPTFSLSYSLSPNSGGRAAGNSEMKSDKLLCKAIVGERERRGGEQKNKNCVVHSQRFCVLSLNTLPTRCSRLSKRI